MCPVSWLFGRAYVRDPGCPLRFRTGRPTPTTRDAHDSKAGKALNGHLDHRNPLVFDTHELGRRPGALKRLTRSADAPKDLGIDGVIGVPEGAPVELDVRLESVMEGVLVTGTARASAEGSA